MADDLAAWLEGTQVARIFQTARGELRLQYTDEAIEQFGLGTPLLSLSLPVRTEPYTNSRTRAFVDGLLPEDRVRSNLARALGVAEDTYSLISAIGRDCAGAIVIQPVSEGAPAANLADGGPTLTESEIATLIDELPNTPLGAGPGVRISLAGVQEKLLLTRLSDGSWLRPHSRLPSTHILKPENRTYDSMVENEAFCMRFAASAGITTAKVDILSIAGRKVLVVERYDRRRQSDGKLSRVHQEDFCQATATPPSRKYENQGGPSLRDIAEILQTTALPDSIGEFFATLMVNVILANSDAHAKNFALMLEPGAPIRLAPRYDLISTFRYPVDHHFAMKVHDVERMENVKLEHVILEASGWGMSRSTAEEVAIDLLNRVPDFVESAGRLTPGVPDDILELAMERATNLKRGLRASGEP